MKPEWRIAVKSALSGLAVSIFLLGGLTLLGSHIAAARSVATTLLVPAAGFALGLALAGRICLREFKAVASSAGLVRCLLLLFTWYVVGWLPAFGMVPAV
jgi:hypothetical protein